MSCSPWKARFGLTTWAAMAKRGAVRELHRRLGAKKCLMGNFNPKFLRDSTTAEVAAAAKAMVGENMPGGGYIFNTGEGVIHTTPAENVEAMMRAAKAAAAAVTNRKR